MPSDEISEYARGPQPGSSVPVAPPRQNPRLSESTTREWVEYCRATLDDAGAPRQGPNPKPRKPGDRLMQSNWTEWAVEWHPHEGRAGGLEMRADEEDARHLLNRYPTWPGRVVRRTVTVSEWQPVEAASNG